MMDIENIYTLIISKLSKRYDGRLLLKTNSGISHTRIFDEIHHDYHKDRFSVSLDEGELPILECNLKDENYFLMSTIRMISVFDGVKYSLRFSDYWWHDRDVFRKNLPFHEGETRIFRYFSINRDSFWYEIDSGEPADAAHNCILYYMRKVVYPSDFLLPDW